MVKRYFTLLLIISLKKNELITAQNNSKPTDTLLKGELTSTQDPIKLAAIYLTDLKSYTTGDEKGAFTIKVSENSKINVSVSAISFIAYHGKIDVRNQGKNILVINLKASKAALDQIVVTSTLKTVTKLDRPLPVELYDKSFFKKNPTPSIFEYVQNANDVRPQLNANLCHTGNIHINSLKSPYTVIRIDGLPIGRGLSTLYGLTGIPQSLIEGVKIVKDPASTLYGSEAVGGVINIVTKEPYASPRISIVNFTTIFNEVHTNVGARYALSKTVDLLLGISYLNYQNPIDNNGANFTNLTQQNRISIFNKLNIDLDILNVLPLAGRYVYEDRWRGGMDWTIANRIGDEVSGESIFTNRWTFFGNYDLPGREDLSFQFSAYEHKQDSFYGETSYQASQYRGVGQLVRNKKLSSKHDLFMGAAYRYTYYDDTMFTTSTVNGLSNNPSLIHLPGVFVQDEISLKENKKLLLGMKYDYNNVHPSVLSPGAHFKCNNSKKTDILRINAGSGFKVAPIFTEDHAPLTGERQVVSEGALRPETSWSSSVVHVKSFTTKNNTFINLDATACYTYFTNRIIPDYDTDPDQSIYAHLDGNSISQGVSLNAHIVFKNGLKELAGATFMEFFITEGGERTRPLLTEGYVGVWSMALGLNVDNTDSLYGYVGLPFLSNTNAYPDATDPRDGNSPVRSIQNIHPTKKLGYTRKLFGGVKNLLNFTPADNSIARAFEPFDRGVNFNSNGKAVPTSGIPNGLTFNPAFMYAYYQGILGFSGIRYTVF